MDMKEARTVACAAAESCNTVQKLGRAVRCNYSVSDIVALQIIYPDEQQKHRDKVINILYNV